MKQKVTIVIFALLVLSSQQDTSPQPGVTVNCQSNDSCSDTASSCGLAGSSGNWQKQDKLCQVKNCRLLQGGNVTISNFACASCYPKDDTQKDKDGNIYSNLQGTQCVNINCAQLSFNAKMTTQYCEICVGKGSIVNDDLSTCILPNDVLYSQFIQFTAASLAAYFFFI